MHTEEITLDLNKKRGRSHQDEPIILRKGEKNETKILINVTDNGTAYSMSGMTARFCAVLHNGARVYDNSNVSISGTTISYTVQSNLTSADGDVAVAYVELTSGTKTITTDNIPFLILENTDISTSEAEQYQSLIDDLIRQANSALSTANSANTKANDALGQANQAITNANSAKTTADNAAKSANTAASSANTAASKANTAASSADAAARSANDAAATVSKAMESYKTITTEDVTFQVGDSGTTTPTGTWQKSVTPVKGKWLWTKRVTNYNQGNPLTTYAAVYVGQDGTFSGENRVTALEDKVEALNDMTTGINLVRGSRDFAAGSIPYGNKDNIMIDGMGNRESANYSYFVDDEGYTVCKYLGNASSTIYRSLNAITPGMVNGNTLTVSVEFMLDGADTSNGYVIQLFMRDLANDENSKTLKNFAYSDAGFNYKDLEPGKWYKAVFHYDTVFNLTNDQYLRVGIAGGAATNYKRIISFRKPKVEIGHINNPIYSLSPVDTVEKYEINDETTGINLLRGTRDFYKGVISAGVRETGLKSDGITFSAGQWEVVQPDNPNDFAYVKRIPTGTASHLYFNPLRPSEINDNKFTVSFEFMFEEPPTANTNFIQFLVLNNDNTDIAQQVVVGTTNVGFSTYRDIPTNKWIKGSFVFNDVTVQENQYIRLGLVGSSTETVSKCVRKVKLESGSIYNPIWSISPFDVMRVSKFLTTTSIDVGKYITMNDGFNSPTLARLHMVGDKVVQLCVEFSSKNAIEDGEFFSPFVMSSEIRPIIHTMANCSIHASGWIVSSTGAASMRAITSINANATMDFCSTYILGNNTNPDQLTATIPNLPGNSAPIPLPEMPGIEDSPQTLPSPGVEIPIEFEEPEE